MIEALIKRRSGKFPKHFPLVVVVTGASKFMDVKKRLGLLASLLFGCAAFAAMMSWNQNRMHINAINGDEPHYLVMARGILHFGSFEISRPYQEEFQNRFLADRQLAPLGAVPSPENTHGALGPHGLYSNHNIGLPLLLTLPVAIGGVVAAKLFMVLCGSLIVYLTWVISAAFSSNHLHRLWATLATCLAAPFIPASTQIYPDLIAGLLALVGLYWFQTANEMRRPAAEWTMAIAVAFLPWLQVKFAPTSAILAAAIALKLTIGGGQRSAAIRLFLIEITSVALLVLYNFYAFGKFSGPYHPGMMEFSKTSVMVFTGLLIDQNQGFLMQNPVDFIGIIALGSLFRRDRSLALLLLVLFVTLLLPNALHTVWYGGFSFAGRFGWSAATVFLVAVVYGLLRLAAKSEALFYFVVGLSLGLQAYLFYLYAFCEVNLYNRPATTPVESYSIYFFPIDQWLPRLYDSDWAFGFLPNYAWLLFLGGLVILGFGGRSLSPRAAILVTVPLLLDIPVAALLDGSPHIDIPYNIAQLPSGTGRIVDGERVGVQGVDRAGFLTFGPYFPLRRGHFRLTLRYSSTAPEGGVQGIFDVFDASSQMRIGHLDLVGTGGTTRQVEMPFEISNWEFHKFEFRNEWNGKFNIQIKALRLQRN